MVQTSPQNLYGFPQPLTQVFPAPILAQRAPTTTDYKYPLMQEWLDESTADAYILVQVVANVATWGLFSSATGIVDMLTADSGTATATAGNINVLGTANQIHTVASASTVTWSIPAVFIAPGSIASTTTLTGGTGITATTGNIVASTGNITSTLGSVAAATTVTAGTSITATLGNITATNGNFVASTAGTGILLNPTTASGTTTATLNGRVGQVTITTPSIGAGGTFSFALTNSSVTASSTQILYALTGGTTGAAITIQSVTNSASTSTIVFMNGSGDTASTDSLVLTFLVLN